MKWKRKGGVATAAQTGELYKVKDDGEFSVRLSSGKWMADIAESAEAARALCEQRAAIHALEIAANKESLRLRRESVAHASGAARRRKHWAHAAAWLLAEVIYNSHHAEYILGQVEQGSVTQVALETTLADHEFCALLRQLLRPDAEARIEQNLLRWVEEAR
jgi:hypothetical protein